MGLDMYLEKRTYIGNTWKDKNQQTPIKIEGVKQERVTEITEQVGYWRKANHIHQWFIDNVQDGNDDCKEYHVSTEELETLRDTCRKVIASLEQSPTKKIRLKIGYRDGEELYGEHTVFTDTETAEELLPTQEGFFFGSTEYDQHYLDDLKETEQIITDVLAEGEGMGSFYYSSSW